MTIRVDLIRPNTNHTDRRLQHFGRASCEVAGRRFQTQGPAPIYRMLSLLWLHGHGGAVFEVYDDLGPTGRPGGLAMRGKVRNWARFVNRKPKFVSDAPAEAVLSPDERDLVARAAGSVAEIDSPRPDNGRTATTHPLDLPRHPQKQEGPSARLGQPRTPEAA